MAHRGHILVTGGAGYIGSHCCKMLAHAGFVPVAYDNLSIGRRDFVKWGPLFEGDIRDEAALIRALKYYRPIAVMHFAALALVGESMIAPDKYWDCNVGGTLALLKAMKDCGVALLVFSSTCAVYGAASVSISEELPKSPVNPYGATKLAAERMMDDFGAAFGLKSVRLRYFNASGADRDRQLGEDRDVETHLIPNVLDVALGRKPHLTIFGDDFPTPDGTAVRDYIHVEDLAAAHLSALEYLLEGGETVALNLGTGRGVSVLQVIETAQQVCGRSIPHKIEPRRPGDPPSLVANAELAKSVLGWEPDRSEIEAIVKDAWAWHSSRFEVSRAQV